MFPSRSVSPVAGPAPSAFRVAIVAATALLTGIGPTQADEITYVLPKTDVEVTFEGTVHTQPGPIFAVKTGRFGAVSFLPGEITFERKQSIEEVLEIRIRQATALKDRQALIDVSRQALMAGRPRLFRESLETLRQIAPDDPTAVRMTAFVKAYDEKFDDQAAAAIARATFGPEQPPLSISAGRCVLYVVGNGGSDARKLAQRRALTMERVSETFYFLLALDGAEPTLPARPLVGVWCADSEEYEKLRGRLGPKLAEATGFFAPDPGVSIFYDQSSNSRFAPLLALADALQKERDEARRKNSPNLQEIVRRAEATNLVANAAKERAEVETVAHESVHQLLALSGLLPSDSHPPRSLHEGWATYFEGSGAEGWAGPGTLLKERHDRLVELLESPGSLSLVEVLSQAPRPGRDELTLLDSYAYCWGAVHFLAQTRPQALYAFTRDVARESKKEPLTPQRIAELLAAATGEDLAGLDAEWRGYVAGLGK